MSKHQIQQFLAKINRIFSLSFTGSDLHDLSSTRQRSAHRDIQEERRSGDGGVRLDRVGDAGT